MKNDTAEWVRRGTALSSVFPRDLPASRPRRMVRLAVEGAVAAFVSCIFARAADGTEAGVISVFLTSAGLSSRFDKLLDENRAAIFGESPAGANRLTAGSLLSVFLGVFAAYATVVLAFPDARIATTTGFLADTMHLAHETILTRRFGSFLGLFGYNMGVLATFCVISVFYRSLGALLALSWNAATWAIALSILVRRAITVTGMSKAVFLTLAWSAILPHLILEAAAYVTASLASIFLSRGLFLYGGGDARLKSVLGAVAQMMSISVALLATAALAESTLPQLLLSKLG
jgi:hypothetical protein